MICHLNFNLLTVPGIVLHGGGGGGSMSISCGNVVLSLLQGKEIQRWQNNVIIQG